MNDEKDSGISYPGLLTVIFVALKLAKVITWSWLWVLSPIWISFIIGLIALLYYKCKPYEFNRKERNPFD